MSIISKLALCVQAGVPVLLWGAPGVGKTATIKGIASALTDRIAVNYNVEPRRRSA